MPILKGMGGVTLRRMARWLTAGMVVVTVGAPAARADTVDYPGELIFPVVGDNHYSDTFGAPRSGGRLHHGVDIMADKMTPIVAVDSGFVGWMDDDQGGDCCAMAIRHDTGWETWYIHMNNDTPGTDDGQGWGFAEGIVQGVRVEAGQLIGYVGDSGNAENTSPHLHWEIHDGAGTVRNPTPYADAAARIDEPGVVWDGRFRDDEASVHESNIDKIATAGITRGCNPPANDRYCPADHVTRGQMAAFIRRMLALPATQADFFADDSDSIFAGDINALAEAGIAFGCTTTDYCPDQDLSRAEMAELLVRTFGYTNPDGTDFFTDDAGYLFEESINELRAAGVTVGCNPPANDQYCPADPVTRGQMATFFARALAL